MAIKFGDDEYGPYKTQDEAMLFAIDAAQKLGEYGESAEVCLMGENGHFHTGMGRRPRTSAYQPRRA